MPYKRQYKRYTKKNYGKSRFNRYAGYAGSAMSTATKALVLAHGIKKLLNVEFKFHDVVSAITPSTTPSIQQLTNIAQGDTDSTRDGAQIKIVRYNCKYSVIKNPSASATLLRVMLVLDKQTNGAIYNIADLLADVTADENIISMLNLDNKFRFRVLYNQVHKLTPALAIGYKEIMKDIDIKIRFDASTPSIADLTSYSLSFVFISNEATDTPAVKFFSRVRYVDN